MTFARVLCNLNHNGVYRSCGFSKSSFEPIVRTEKKKAVTKQCIFSDKIHRGISSYDELKMVKFVRQFYSSNLTENLRFFIFSIGHMNVRYCTCQIFRLKDYVICINSLSIESNKMS